MRAPFALASFVSISFAAAAQGPPPNDDCAGAAVLTLSGVTVDNTQATNSSQPWPCGNGGADVWYRYTAATTDDIEFSTCSLSTTYDTVIEVFIGDCSTLVSIACDDDACAPFLFSRVLVQGVVPGTEYFVRIGGSNAATGVAELFVSEVFPLTPQCLEMDSDGHEVGALGGALYFDLQATRTVGLFRLALNFDEPAGTPVDLELWTRGGSYVGNVASSAGWYLAAVDVGGAVCAGPDRNTWVDLTPGVFLDAADQGVAVVARSTSHRFSTVGAGGSAAVTGDGVLRLTAGATGDVPFAGGVVSGRAPSLIVCYETVGIGSNYCAAVINSTGVTGLMVALGSDVVADNDVTLSAVRLPRSSFGFFLTSTTAGFVAQVGGSQGNLCLGGAIGRYVGAGQILNTGAVGSL